MLRFALSALATKVKLSAAKQEGCGAAPAVPLPPGHTYSQGRTRRRHAMAVDRMTYPLSAEARRMALLLPLPLLVAACVGHDIAKDQQAPYRAMIGRSEAELTESLGQPTRRENVGGHDFLIYEQNDVWPGHGGEWSRPTRIGRHEPGAVDFECRATFVVVAGVVSTYNLSGSGCGG